MRGGGELGSLPKLLQVYKLVSSACTRSENQEVLTFMLLILEDTMVHADTE